MADSEIFVNEVVLSPLGITIDYKSTDNDYLRNITDKAYVTYNDGTIINLQEVSRGNNGGDFTSSFSYPIVEIEKVHTININGQEFSVNGK